MEWAIGGGVVGFLGGQYGGAIFRLLPKARLLGLYIVIDISFPGGLGTDEVPLRERDALEEAITEHIAKVSVKQHPKKTILLY